MSRERSERALQDPHRWSSQPAAGQSARVFSGPKIHGNWFSLYTAVTVQFLHRFGFDQYRRSDIKYPQI